MRVFLQPFALNVINLDVAINNAKEFLIQIQFILDDAHDVVILLDPKQHLSDLGELATVWAHLKGVDYEYLLLDGWGVAVRSDVVGEKEQLDGVDEVGRGVSDEVAQVGWRKRLEIELHCQEQDREVLEETTGH